LFAAKMSAESEKPTDLERCIRTNNNKFPHVVAMEGFVIFGSPQGDATASVEEIFIKTVARFRWLMYNSDGSVRSADVCRALKEKLCFGCGNMANGHADVEDAVYREFGNYVMSMKCDTWHYNPSWEGMFPADEVQNFVKSLWRPEGSCAVWEETLHTITEAFNRLSSMDPEQYSMWSFEEGSQLGNLMQEDIDAGNYDIEEQNRVENGQYNFITAVNEYVHQVWVVHYAGHGDLLQGPKARVLEILTATPGMPLRSD